MDAFFLWGKAAKRETLTLQWQCDGDKSKRRDIVVRINVIELLNAPVHVLASWWDNWGRYSDE